MNIRLLFALLIIIGAGIAEAQSPDTKSANVIMPGCRHFLSTSADFGSGVCAGQVNALAQTGRLMTQSLANCVPEGVTNEQLVRVVVAYIDRIPERTHEPFILLAIEALHAAWPCK